MKDLEKIKSEDLAAQVQDANPANFAIEQEVAQLVGATVPQPTEPSADDARELGAQLLVFLRRALLPIRSALRTALAAIYAHLDSRCTDYTPAAYASYIPRPYDPMRPFAPRTLPNLLTAITAFSARKISNGSAPNDGIPDGVSLARLVCTKPTLVLKDDSPKWTLSQDFNAIVTTIFPNIEKIYMNCDTTADSSGNDYLRVTSQMNSIKELHFYGLTYYHERYDWYAGTGCFRCPNLEVFEAPELVTISAGHSALFIADCPITKLSFPKLKTINSRFIFGNTHLQELDIPECTYLSTPVGLTSDYLCLDGNTALARVRMGRVTAIGKTAFKDCTALIDLEFADGVESNINLTSWNPTDKGTTFLQNFKNHIALRLTSNGRGLTLTLSQAVRDAIHAAEATYGIEAIIVTQKGWTLSPAPTA